MQAEQRKTRIQALATQRFGHAPERLERPLTVLASPVWRGVEADLWVAHSATQTEIYKHYHPDTYAYVDVPAALAAADAAGACGAGSAVLQTWPQDGIMVMTHLGDGWQSGGLHHVGNARVRANVIAAKKRLHGCAALPRDGDIFVEIEHLQAACVQARAAQPRNMPAYLDFARQARAVITALGADKVPCHRDGSTANFMVGPDSAVKLIDFDLAANTDPYEDLGCFLLEFFERDPEMRQGFEEWEGRFHAGLFQRAVLYGMLDDLRWGLIGLWMQATSPRSTLEFSKYAAWRLMRFVTMAQNASAWDRLRSVA